MHAQILVVAPFAELADSIRQVIEECFVSQKNLFRVLEEDLQDAERLVKQGLPKSIKVIVSRGGCRSRGRGYGLCPAKKI